jgi:hypothetical protein
MSLSKCDCNTLRIAVYKSFSVTVPFVHYVGRFTHRILAAAGVASGKLR